MYAETASLFLRVGLLFVPLGLLVSILQLLILGGFGLLGIDTTGESAGALVLLVVAVGTLVTLLGLTIVQAATACALVEIDAGRPIRAMAAYRMAFRKIRPLLGGLALAAGAWLVLDPTAVLTPGAVWLAVRWMLLAQAVVLEDRSAP